MVHLPTVIELAGVSRRFGRVVALEGVSFAVAPGEIVGFLGENGAGKTTTLRILAGVLAADAGRVVVDGVEGAAARTRLGYLPEGAPVYPELKVREYLRFRATLKDVAAARVEEVVRAFALDEVAARPCGQLSRGFRQRLGLAEATLAQPKVLLLDEPTTGLDPNQVRELRQVVRALAPAHTVLFSSHVLAEVEAVAARVVVLSRGKIVGEGTPAELAARFGSLEEAFVQLTRRPAA